MLYNTTALREKHFWGEILNRYILNLYKQYCDAIGIICEPSNITNLPDSFIEWVAQNKLLSKKYKEYLLSLGYIDGKSVYEIEKGKYDAISSDKSRIISSYGETLGQENLDFFIIGNTPLIQSSKEIIVPDIDIFLTHNPFEEMHSENWFRMHNTGLYDISIGMYGSVYEEDFGKKIKFLEMISSKMTEDHRIDYDTDKDKYFCTLNSERKIKRLILTK